jgi:hypothetical protein
VARYVVLSFEDNAQADCLIEDMLEYPDGRILTPVQENDVEADLVGLFAKPTVFHDDTCPGSGKRVRPWARGTKFGWWVCAICKRPAPGQGKDHREEELNLARHVISQGTNLLPPEVPFVPAQAPATVFDDGWGALGRD